jgi:hypothetical protein
MNLKEVMADIKEYIMGISFQGYLMIVIALIYAWNLYNKEYIFAVLCLILFMWIDIRNAMESKL